MFMFVCPYRVATRPVWCVWVGGIKTASTYERVSFHNPVNMPSKSIAKGGKVSSKVKGSEGSKSQSRSHRAGLQFPVSRIHRLMRKSALGRRIGSGAPGRSLFHSTFHVLTCWYVQYTLRPCSSICLQKFSSSPVMLPAITRNVVSTRDISNWLFVTTKSA